MGAEATTRGSTAHGWYERRKYRLTVASLPRSHYRRAFEPGCGAGYLTELLAGRVDHLVALDRAPRAVRVARRRCARWPGVRVTEGRIPGDWPDGAFDLIVLSELLYYLDDDQLEQAMGRAVDCLRPGGHLVAVHYRRPVREHARAGDEVHERLTDAVPHVLVRHVEDDFLLEVRTT